VVEASVVGVRESDDELSGAMKHLVQVEEVAAWGEKEGDQRQKADTRKDS